MLTSVISICLFILLLVGCEPMQQGREVSMNAVPKLGVDVEPNTLLSFPQDHGAHLAQGIEWWYVTANLEADDGTEFGVQWTLFRTSVGNTDARSSRWWDGQLYFAHFAIQNNQTHKAFEKFARAGQVEIAAAPFVARIDNWYLKGGADQTFPLNLMAKQGGFSAQLALHNSVMALHGDKGYSQKTMQGHASYYYSYPFLHAKGALEFFGKRYKVTGKAWLDREWSSSLIDPKHTGWDWFSLQANNADNGALMVFCIRNALQEYDHCSGSHILSSGEVQHLADSQISLQPIEHVSLDGKRYPTQWHLDVTGFDTTIINSVNKDARNQLSIPYWEGRVTSVGGFTAKGYAELVGY
ncbi:lipocalin-like domain-containing protein [Pseudoalteromonas aurantia]|uniref:AttH domain-containing protein n=1 Tax=Pseudoalteromonas aurantia 208 TaxID=1314867 RepID=A0ABR9EIF5_9GAMM|nr:lipocalin-like domain-containing protein [Pseudoalteromonas aurantia]MBE0370776.1 hypothetical protein [Pseudoalteromonas aurantia 208]